MQFQTFLKFCLNPVVVYRGQWSHIRDMLKFLMSVYEWSHKLFLKNLKRKRGLETFYNFLIY